MTKLRFRIAMSLDGCAAGPQQSKQNPLGIGGLRLHEWAIHLVPGLLGADERLFEGIRDLGGLELVRTVAATNVTHLKFAKP